MASYCIMTKPDHNYSLRTGCVAAKQQILPPPPYSPDKTPCDFRLFPQLKKPLRGKRFAGNKSCVKAAEAILMKLSQNGLIHVFKRTKTLGYMHYVPRKLF
ncbi:histone-lysine N-methyltransferase SETMAR [Trichonephila clavipes]|nr:histone-lysine N-methyltransferase SETMAR [Trichonephila clavipes]